MEYKTCQSCEIRPVETDQPAGDSDEPLRLCLECNRRLQARALRPVEWYNLAKRHGWQEFLLHDDFYDEEGTALQPTEKVDEPERFPAPTLEAVAQDAELLLDYSITRWSLQQPVISAWLALEPSKVLATLSSRFASTRNLLIRDKLLEICALALRGPGADFVRYAWGEYPATVTLPPLAQASAACLPPAEGFDRVSAALEPEIKKRKWDLIFCLGYFQSPKALGWIEQHVAEPVTEAWGYLAAASRLDWLRVENWLRGGRPLSLVALDALGAILRPRTLLLKSIKPRLHGPPDIGSFREELILHAKRDPVPRVQQRTEVLLKDAESLLRGTK
jgi:hypothetical protein